ncbi:MAG TPA: hypothetical protein VEN29_17860 [Casimicrobiaceae bacterium]|nr:hypothetical protein [Casimicrobiaceae bacterium]
MSVLAMLGRLGQRLGPYLIIELLLPGGSLLALLFFLRERGWLLRARRALWAGFAANRAIPGFEPALRPCCVRSSQESNSVRRKP